MQDKNGNTVDDWIRWHETQCGHKATAEDQRQIMQLIAAGYYLDTPDAAAAVHRL